MANDQTGAQIHDLLKRQILLRYLNEQQLSIIAKLSKLKEYEKDEIILREGEFSQHLFMILDGEVEVLKWDNEQQNQFVIGRLSQNDFVGEMSFIDKGPRSSTVKVVKKAKLLRLDRESLTHDDPQIRAIYDQIIANILNINMGRLRDTNLNYAQSLRAELEQLKSRNEFAKVFVIILICFGVNNLFNLLLYTYHFSDATLIFNWSYILLFLVPIVIFMVKDHVSPQTFGVTFKNTKQSIIEALVISLGLFVIFFIYLYFYGKFVNLDFPQLLAKVRKTYTDPTLIVYFFHVYAQEFIARGALQTSLQKFFMDDKGYAAILVASFIFFVFHLHLGFLFAGITFISSLFFGLIYVRQRNLLGVTIIHFVLGTFGKVFRLF